MSGNWTQSSEWKNNAKDLAWSLLKLTILWIPQLTKRLCQRTKLFAFLHIIFNLGNRCYKDEFLKIACTSKISPNYSVFCVKTLLKTNTKITFITSSYIGLLVDLATWVSRFWLDKDTRTNGWMLFPGSCRPSITLIRILTRKKQYL